MKESKKESKHRPRRLSRLGLAVGLMLAAIPSAGAEQPAVTGAGFSRDGALDSLDEGGRDPLGTLRTSTRPRVWILFDTSESMDLSMGDGTRFDTAQEVVRWAVRNLESESGEPLVHWRLAAFQQFRRSEDGSSREQICADPTMGAGLPSGSGPGPPISPVRCGGVRILSDPSGCDTEAARRALLRELPDDLNTNRTPNGIALYQLATHIAATAMHDLEAGQQNVIVLITDGLDTCECIFHPWLDFNEGPAGRGGDDAVWLRTGHATSEARRYPDPTTEAFVAWNAGLKAKAAYLALNGGNPNAGLGDIHVVGVAMSDEETRGYTNHLAWMASYGRRPAIHADRPESLRQALAQVLGEITLPVGEVKLSAPRLATVKELVAGSPTAAFPGSDPALRWDALVAPATRGERLEEVIRLRGAYPDNILLSTSADLSSFKGGLRALPIQPGGGGTLDTTPVWDAGSRLAHRDPDDRLMLFNRPGSRELLPFRIDEVTPRDLGVHAGYLNELDGAGARTAEDAARIVVRLVRGEELAVHPETGTIYGPDGDLHFIGGRGTWKLREGLASPVVVTSPPRHPDRVSRQGEGYRDFFVRHVNRRTMVYLPTSGGMVHAFAGDSGEEVFAYIPDDVLGPASPVEDTAARAFLRDLALAGVRGAAGLQRGLVHRFALAGSPVVRDVFLEGSQEWRTVLALGRSVGGRFVTAVDVSNVGDGWAGGHHPPRPSIGGPGLPRLLFNIGSRAGNPGGIVDELGETPEPLMAEVAATSGSTWLTFLPAGRGSPDSDSGEWLLVLAIEDGRVRSRHRIEPAPSPRIQKNGAVTSAAAWQPAWAVSGAPDVVTQVYLADLHGQIHRLRLLEPDNWQWGVAHRLGGEYPILTPPVAFPFPGRVEPHLLVVTGGDRRVRDIPSDIVLLRDTGTNLQEVWRTTLSAGELPQGKPAVLRNGSEIEVVLATRSVQREELSCNVTTTGDGVARLRAFNGLTGAEMVGVVDAASSLAAFGRGRIRGISLSSSGNMAFSVSGVGGKIVDTVIGDFEFRVRDSALENVTLFVEGFRRSPFWIR